MIFFGKRAFVSTVSLAIVVSVSGWFVIKSAEEQVLKGDIPPNFVVNTAENLRYIKTTDKGSIAYIADAKTAKRYQNEDAIMSDVKIRVFNTQDPSQKPWDISSNHAKVTNNNNNAQMYDHVVMQRAGDGINTPPIKIASELVNYDNNKDFINTDKLVTITEPDTDNITTGVGLTGHPNQGDYQLLSNVRSYYVGNKK